MNVHRYKRATKEYIVLPMYIVYVDYVADQLSCCVKGPTK